MLNLPRKNSTCSGALEGENFIHIEKDGFFIVHMDCRGNWYHTTHKAINSMEFICSNECAFALEAVIKSWFQKALCDFSKRV